MKTIYTLFCVAIISGLNAQITLTKEANTPKVGGDFFDYMVSYNLGVGAGGANQIWDFSSAGLDGFYSEEYCDLSCGTMSMSQANLVGLLGGGGVENYYVVSDTAFALRGIHDSGASTVARYGVSGVDLLRFPMTYGDSYTDTISGSFEEVTFYETYSRTGDLQVEADGYGTLILPNDTIYDVLRVRSEYNYTDTNMGTVVNSYLSIRYDWYNSYTSTYICTVNDYGGFYLEPPYLITDTEEAVETDSPITVFPNPSKDYVVFNLDSFAKKPTITLYNVQGKVAKKQQLINNRLSVSHLQSGVYFYELFYNGQTNRGKIVVE